MANKRALKKYFRATAADLAGETVFVQQYFENINNDEVEAILDDILALLIGATQKVTVAYDKNVKESFGGDAKAYRAAKAKYYKQCYGLLVDEYNEEYGKVLSRMNALLSKEQREANRKMA